MVKWTFGCQTEGTCETLRDPNQSCNRLIPNCEEGKKDSIDIATFLIESFYEASTFKDGLHNQHLLNGEGQSIMIAAT
jgi:hypothetical protein